MVKLLRGDVHTKVWENCLRTIRAKVDSQAFATWFEPIVPVRVAENVITIQVPSQLFYEWLEQHYVEELRTAISKELGPTGRLEYSIVVDRQNDLYQPMATVSPGVQAPIKSTSNGRKAQSTLARQILDEATINPHYTFDTYVEGGCNQLARAAGMAVADRPGATSFNPLVIYGGVGLGKTHLLHAIANRIQKLDPTKVCLYTNSDKFTDQFIAALQNQQMPEFQQAYSKVDVLIIDDIQFFAGKEKTQDIFYSLFNYLHTNRKQIILTSDRPPREIKGIVDRLLSRFKMGLTADLQVPDLETRMAIIQSKLELEQTVVPRDVIEFIARTVKTNVRELEGVLVSLLAQASLTRRSLDMALAKQTLQNIVTDVEHEVNLDFIQRTVAEFFLVSVEDLKGKVRKKEIVIPRQVAMYFAKQYTTHSLKNIGAAFGGKDHSTVIHSIGSVDDLVQSDIRFRTRLQELEKRFAR